MKDSERFNKIIGTLLNLEHAIRLFERSVTPASGDITAKIAQLLHLQERLLGGYQVSMRIALRAEQAYEDEEDAPDA
jgi:hypothetical protein